MAGKQTEILSAEHVCASLMERVCEWGPLCFHKIIVILGLLWYCTNITWSSRKVGEVRAGESYKCSWQQHFCQLQPTYSTLWDTSTSLLDPVLIWTVNDCSKCGCYFPPKKYIICTSVWAHEQCNPGIAPPPLKWHRSKSVTSYKQIYLELQISFLGDETITTI